MPEQRRKFSPRFRAEAVQMVLETGKPIAEVALDLGINDGTLGNWVDLWRREVFHNRRRLHSTLGYRTPFEAFTDYRTAATAAA